MEDRQLLDANPSSPIPPALVTSLTQTRDEVATDTITLLNAERGSLSQAFAALTATPLGQSIEHLIGEVDTLLGLPDPFAPHNLG